MRIVAVTGVTAIDVTVAVVRVVEPATAPNVAVIVAVPVADGDAEARPVWVMVTTELDESQVTKEERSWAAPPSSVPVAVYCSDVPEAMV